MLLNLALVFVLSLVLALEPVAKHHRKSSSSSSGSSSSSHSVPEFPLGNCYQCADCRANGLPGHGGKRGKKGPRGTTGPRGFQGIDGAPGVSTVNNCFIYAEVDVEDPKEGQADIPILLNYTANFTMGGCFNLTNSSYINILEDGMYIAYYQVIPIYPAKILLMVDGNIYENSIFGKDMSVAKDKDNGGMYSDYQAGQIVMALLAGQVVTMHMVAEIPILEWQLPMSLTMMRLSPDLPELL